MNYEPIIGLEVHVELKTKSKMFCGCSADYFGNKPNTHTCPTCLGLPGALPVPNKTAIEWCIKIGIALNCEIPLTSKFDRKNYFYPDLAKGYQISQYDQPFCQNGWIEVLTEDNKIKRIGITRVHMEEDTGKLSHKGNVSLIDFNRSGVPLVEIVTEPDFRSSFEVNQYLQKLQQIVRYLNVSNADMEKGDMRLEPNISLRIIGEIELPKYKVEIKNINSFRFVDKSIQFEIKRQRELLDKNEIPLQETRGWEELKQITISQRIKEKANDYRYFPEPDIPPIEWDKLQIDKITSQMPELPNDKLIRFEKEYQLSSYNAEILIRDASLAAYFEKAVFQSKGVLSQKQIANTLINKKINILSISVKDLIKDIIHSSKKEGIDEIELSKITDDVLKNNQKAVDEFRNGKEVVIMFLIGQVMKSINKKIDIEIIKNILKNKLNKK
ncbi:aspartyl/glutamyl-tRNA(Asn/Gln) amidotransferase subunit B 2 [Candidatus Levyibacteriota bacterium]|nr:Asp-tRNA(Asn)/Glu-tRNA(Gln) amidotransferase subunit GatB [Candidatus Levybacteria bacterium]GDX61930.1 aspartyl/glutamyl-tRNA(Asn/Gln) amidotransferase subunit B 2 [Candidatus Levybacteria bacterium]